MLKTSKKMDGDTSYNFNLPTVGRGITIKKKLPDIPYVEQSGLTKTMALVKLIKSVGPIVKVIYC